MNINMKRTFLSVLTVAAISSVSAVNAADTGIIKFNGILGANTCTVTGLDGTLVFDSVDTATLEAAAQLSTIVTKNIPISLSACPASITKGKLAVTFAADDVNGIYPTVTGPMRGMTMFHYASPSASYNQRMPSGHVADINISNGSGAATLQTRMVRTVNEQDGIVEGDYASEMTLAMTYE